jgi:phage baseplate assembly protein W
MATMNSNKFINSDLNVRLSAVNSQDTTVIVDKEAIMQSIYRLFKTEEGEIPYFRKYGLNLKQFLQRPLGPMLAREISDYISRKIESYEQRVEVYKVNAIANFEDQSIIIQYYIRIKTTGEIVGLEPLVVPIG